MSAALSVADSAAFMLVSAWLWIAAYRASCARRFASSTIAVSLPTPTGCRRLRGRTPAPVVESGTTGPDRLLAPTASLPDDRPGEGHPMICEGATMNKTELRDAVAQAAGLNDTQAD